MLTNRHAVFYLVAGVVVGISSISMAGGGGENMLLVVNANDENAIRIATAYQNIRNVPSQNIVFITPGTYLGMSCVIPVTDETGFKSTYITPVVNAIDDRELSSQIDYIGAIGLPTAVSTKKYNWGYSSSFVSM